MIGLDAADLVVIASEVLGCDVGTALAQADIAAADDALAQAGVAGKARSPGGARGGRAGAESRPHPADAAEAAAALMDALLRHPPFPAHREQIAVAAGLQFLAVNGWQAYLDVPRAAVIVIERLASGQLTPAQAASWLAVRLYPGPGSPAGRDTGQPWRHPGPRWRRSRAPSGGGTAGGHAPAPSSSTSARATCPGAIITPLTGPLAVHRSRQQRPYPRQAGMLTAGPAPRSRAHPAGPCQCR